MKLLAKFNLLLIAVFGLGLFLIAYEAQSFLQEQAQAEVLREAGLMAASALATRNYTEHYITPVIEKTTEHTTTFLPQAIPFFASTTTFEQIRQTYPDYTYKEAALNPTNLRDRATDWEADIINYFRNSPKETELVRMREGATGPSLALAHPIRVESGCLQCHSQPTISPQGTHQALRSAKWIRLEPGRGHRRPDHIDSDLLTHKDGAARIDSAPDQPIGDFPGGDSADRYGIVFHRHPAATQDFQLRGPDQ